MPTARSLLSFASPSPTDYDFHNGSVLKFFLSGIFAKENENYTLLKSCTMERMWAKHQLGGQNVTSQNKTGMIMELFHWFGKGLVLICNAKNKPGQLIKCQAAVFSPNSTRSLWRRTCKKFQEDLEGRRRKSSISVLGSFSICQKARVKKVVS